MCHSIGRTGVVVPAPSVDVATLDTTFVGITAGVRFVSVSGGLPKGCRRERQFLRNTEEAERLCSFFFLLHSTPETMPGPSGHFSPSSELSLRRFRKGRIYLAQVEVVTHLEADIIPEVD